MARRTAQVDLTAPVCRFFKGGVCGSPTLSQGGQAVYCPRERATACTQLGECCHDPVYGTREKLLSMKRAGFDLNEFRKAADGPGWVERAFQKFATTQTTGPGE